jgi:ubiquinone biosynthesis protein
MQSPRARAREIAFVVAHQTVGVVLDQFDLRVLLPRIHRAPTRAPLRLRRALEELGPTFIKLGQVLSTRPDLVPPAYETELARLQDRAPAVAPDEIVDAVETSLGRPLPKLFERFERVPLACASIGQVHAATLSDGSDVIVKVRRPGVVTRVEIDLDLLERVAHLVARHSTVAARYDPVGLTHEFRTTLLGELDYVREGGNAEFVAAGFAGDARVHIPKVCWDHTCDAVITEERIRGVKIDDVRALDGASLDRTAVARLFVDAYLSMVFVRGFFHADPHPGNVFVESSERIGFVDFGMVGRVAPKTREALGTIMLALVATDAARMADGLLGLGIAGVDVEREPLERDLTAILERYAYVPLQQLRVGPLVAQIMQVVRAHGLRLPSDLALLLKTVMMCEGVAAHLDPGFELVPLLVPYAQQIVTDQQD